MCNHYITVFGHEDIAGSDISNLFASPVESIADISEAVQQIPKLALVKVLIFFGFAVEYFAQKHEG